MQQCRQPLEPIHLVLMVRSGAVCAATNALALIPLASIISAARAATAAIGAKESLVVERKSGTGSPGYLQAATCFSRRRTSSLEGAEAFSKRVGTAGVSAGSITPVFRDSTALSAGASNCSSDPPAFVIDLRSCQCWPNATKDQTLCKQPIRYRAFAIA